ncbi:MAG TPA: patatin-like phospholipase family protein [Usitatibacter sp.]|nr:patatin-like phospholipase family protein [Usitatibacter sp.]
MRCAVAAALLLAVGLAAGPREVRAYHECGVANAPSFDLRHAAPESLRIGVALGSGSMHALAHVGVLESIEESGLRVHVVSGTSAGALVGALWASGVPAREIERMAGAAGWETLRSFAPASGGLMSHEPLRARLATTLTAPIESWPKRFGAVATNVDNGRPRVLMSGDGALAVQASTASPVVFAPVVVGNERLADGALVEPVPVESARAMGAEFVIAVDVGYRPYEERAEGVMQLGFQALNILRNTLGEAQAREADVAIRLDVHESLVRCGPMSLVAVGRDAARHALPEIERALRARASR